MMKMEYAAKSDPGMVRKNNEDNMLVLPEVGLFVVADGMGGHASGEIASKIAVETIKEEAAVIPKLGARRSFWKWLFGRKQTFNAMEFLKKTVKLANSRIYREAQKTPENHGMGTTVAAAIKTEEALLTAHVGDSRIYRLRDSKLTQLTSDHSLAAELVRQGVLTPEEALYSTPKNILTRALGVKEEVAEEIIYHSIEPGDMLLLGSDGLTNMVEDEDLARIISRKNKTIEEKVDDLVDTANKAGGDDNVTVVLVAFG